MQEGLKYDNDKPRYDLIPAEALDDLAKLYSMGAQKYKERNWEKGIKWGRVFAAVMRHAWAWWRGEEIDPESGLSHMVHAAWNCLALVHYEKFNRDFDDRPKHHVEKDFREAAEEFKKAFFEPN